MATVALNDKLFLTLMQCGRMVFNQQVSGIKTRTDLMGKVRELMGGCRGMVKVTLRNCTQGWSHTDTLFFASAR
ncbi:MAG: hypothetical protein K2G94_00420 [Muribaculaceae bacterium]|nr:hypothetical protein [Muribaculaceae bacterium]MDE5959325.1 hypothetical protein [Muribaculaceae bacterium]MDE5971192.1 hypothetical protein [Muribaculaceae bacterium]MDE6462509.1 hypothetical protein [Muribaculaceae bacterium]MDE6509385.1 hypothetical protein [Muribaculaceae bacterium]